MFIFICGILIVFVIRWGGQGPIPNLGPNITQLGLISLQPSRGSPSPSAEHRRLRLKVFLFLPAPIGPAVCFFYHARPAWFLLPQQHTNKYEALPVGFGRFGHDDSIISFGRFGHLFWLGHDDSVMPFGWFGRPIRTIRPYYSDSAMMIRPSHSDDSVTIQIRP